MLPNYQSNAAQHTALDALYQAQRKSSGTPATLETQVRLLQVHNTITRLIQLLLLLLLRLRSSTSNLKSKSRTNIRSRQYHPPAAGTNAASDPSCHTSPNNTQQWRSEDPGWVVTAFCAYCHRLEGLLSATNLSLCSCSLPTHPYTSVTTCCPTITAAKSVWRCC